LAAVRASAKRRASSSFQPASFAALAAFPAAGSIAAPFFSASARCFSSSTSSCNRPGRLSIPPATCGVPLSQLGARTKTRVILSVPIPLGTRRTSTSASPHIVPTIPNQSLSPFWTILFSFAILIRMKPSLIVHGGGWNIQDEAVDACKQGCHRALVAGWTVLATGGSALDAVEAAVVVLEEDPVFDAGYGSHLNLDGHVECDAIVMDGGTLRAGAVAAVRRVRNPIHAAAHHRGHEQGTVGAVALDKEGRLFAATSTGGTCCKLPGRVGDSPLIGCGCYADWTAGAASCTGLGEAIMKIVMAKTAVDFLRRPVSPGEDDQAFAARAAQDAAQLLRERGRGTGGIILLVKSGTP